MTGYTDDERELVALYAVDALDDLDRARAAHLVANSPEAARDLARYTDALAAMIDSATTVTPPASAWDGITETIRATTHDVTPTVPLRRRRGRFGTGAWLAAAAAVLAGVLGGVAVRTLTSGPASNRSQMAAAATRSGTRTGSLRGDGGSATVSVEADGTGWLDLAALPAPGDGNVYQLWSLDTGAPVSLGVVKQSDGVARFTAPPGTRTIALSLEHAPGAASPTLPPVGAVELA